MTQQEADANKVGKAREEPNKDPFLETPTEGRGFLDAFSGIKKLGEAIGNLAGGFMAMFKTLAILAIIAGIAFVIKSIVG